MPVTPGLDPGSDEVRVIPTFGCRDAPSWIAGSSPAMTASYERSAFRPPHCFTQTAVMPCEAAHLADAGCTWAAIGTSARQTADAITSPP